MTGDGLKLTTYLGERDRDGRGFTADALLDLYERREVRASVLLRGVAGFGAGHRMRTDRLLTLSEDLPVVTVAVDGQARIEALVGDVAVLAPRGLITLERARMAEAETAVDGATKLTVYLGRRERAGGRPAFVAVCDALRRGGVAGATVLLGVDGTAHGERARARLLGRNAEVPLMVVAVGASERIAAVLPALRAMLRRPIVTLERVRICKRDGELLAPPEDVAAADEDGMGRWQKLTVHTSEAAIHAGRPVHRELVRRLHAAGGAGVTVLRGIWGFHGDHAPHGDRLLQVRRHVPVVTTIVDTPERVADAFAIADELTAQRGLVTSEVVPALRAAAGSRVHGGLRLARRAA